MNETSMVASDIRVFSYFGPDILQEGCFFDRRDKLEWIGGRSIAETGTESLRFIRAGSVRHQYHSLAHRSVEDELEFCLSLYGSHIHSGYAFSPGYLP